MADPRKFTVIARAADDDGTGIEATYAELDYDAAQKLRLDREREIRPMFQRAFGHIPQRYGAWIMPYVASVDDEEAKDG